MFKVKVLTIGKNKETWLSSALAEYEKRLSSFKIEWILAKNDEQLILYAEKYSPYICLDPMGNLLTSEEFSSKIFSKLEAQGTECTFLIGGPLGIPPSLLSKATHIISLSRMTFTHQICRLLLLEQLYRANEISKGSSYHK